MKDVISGQRSYPRRTTSRCDVVTCKSGEHYRIPSTPTRPALHIRRRGLVVEVGDAQHLLTTLPIERFGGELTPTSIRRYTREA